MIHLIYYVKTIPINCKVVENLSHTEYYICLIEKQTKSSSSELKNFKLDTELKLFGGHLLR